ncbi:MAG TPA: hypothetical protein VMO88_02625, partial [Acidimicrobiales bacterium]|nr:hypothetical protein [Acidimicrobiales bacterium]
MSGTQLERSVLEAKEREELVAIADALGTKPTARAKKSDLVNQILRATGVEAEQAGEEAAKPRRTRARKAASDTASAESGTDEEAAQPSDSPPKVAGASDNGVQIGELASADHLGADRSGEQTGQPQGGSEPGPRDASATRSRGTPPRESRAPSVTNGASNGRPTDAGAHGS